MKNLSGLLCALLFAAILLPSCVGGEEEPPGSGYATDYISRWVYIEDTANAENKSLEFNMDEWMEVDGITMSGVDGWYLSLNNNKIMVSEFNNYKMGEFFFSFEISGGRFVGENEGEWGGRLSYKDDSGGMYELLSYNNPTGMFSVNGNIYVFDRWSHSDYGKGSIHKLINNKGIWEAGETITLNGTPYAFFIEENMVYSIIFFTDPPYFTYNISIIKITVGESGLKIEEIAKKTYDLLAVRFTSMVKSDKKLYIGLFGGIAIFDLDSHELKFYNKLLHN